jgi:hypothetical protein
MGTPGAAGPSPDTEVLLRARFCKASRRRAPRSALQPFPDQRSDRVVVIDDRDAGLCSICLSLICRRARANESKGGNQPKRATRHAKPPRRRVAASGGKLHAATAHQPPGCGPRGRLAYR